MLQNGSAQHSERDPLGPGRERETKYYFFERKTRLPLSMFRGHKTILSDCGGEVDHNRKKTREGRERREKSARNRSYSSGASDASRRWVAALVSQVFRVYNILFAFKNSLVRCSM